MVIRQVRQASPGVYELAPDTGPAFFLRAAYLDVVPEERLVPVAGGLGLSDSLFTGATGLSEGMPGVFTQEEAADIMTAACVFAVEKAAMSYLARAEHCRAALVRKLRKKGMEPNQIDRALDYLEETGYLSDARFAGAWLRNRFIDHAEGRRKLAAELSARGISRADAALALDEFFAQNDERAICGRARRKFQRTHPGAPAEKVEAALRQAGFSSAHIRAALAED